MNSGEHRFRIPRRGIICARLCFLIPAVVLFSGCTGRPNQANIELRKQIQALDARIANLDRRHEADQATIRSLQAQSSTRPSFPPERADQLFTVHGISLGRLTGGAELDAGAAGDDGVKVYVVPIDQTGDQLKASGSFVVELFDLQPAGDARIGRWTFSVEQAKQNWFGQALLYTYVLTCPWQSQRPERSELTLKVTFKDELTGREFGAQKVIVVKTISITSAPAGAT